MGEIGELVVTWCVATALGLALVRRDEARLAPERLARAWPPTTRDLAVVMFGPLAVALHFVRTRRSLRGVALGVAALVAIELGASLPAIVCDALAPEPSAPTNGPSDGPNP